MYALVSRHVVFVEEMRHNYCSRVYETSCYQKICGFCQYWLSLICYDHVYPINAIGDNYNA